MDRRQALTLLSTLLGGVDHAFRWGQPDTPATWWTEDDRPLITMYSPEPCAICEMVMEEWEETGDEMPFRLVKKPLLPDMNKGPWFYWENPNTKSGWSRMLGAVDQGDGLLGFLEKRWRDSLEDGQETIQADPRPFGEYRSRPGPEELREFATTYRGRIWTTSGSYHSHLVRTHGFESWQLQGLPVWQLQKIHGAAHDGVIRFPGLVRSPGARPVTTTSRRRVYCPT